MSDAQRRIIGCLIGLAMVILVCVVALLEERDAQRALRASEAISQEFAESHRNYYRGRPDHASPSD